MQPEHDGSAPKGTPRNFRPNRGGVLKKWLSAYKSSNISETWQGRTKVAIKSNRKSYTRFRLVPKSMTLDDLEGSLCTCFKTRATFGAHCENLNEDRSILSATKM